MKVPISLIIDDPAPVISVYKEHSPAGALTRDGRPLIPTFPNSLLFDFCDVVEAYGIKGKFSIVPMPANKGDIRYGIEGVADEDMKLWLDTVKKRVTPFFTIGPEMLTHYKAVDPASGKPLEMDEKEWAKDKDRSALTPYIAKALSILNEAGFDAFGVTSPWKFGIQVEEEYEALYELLREDQRGNVTVDKIRSIVSDELDGAGYYKQIEKRMVTGTKEKGVHYGVAMFYCEFSEKDVLIRVCFDGQLQLVGFSLMRD